MKNLLILLKKKLSNPFFIFAILGVLGIIAFVLSPKFMDSSQPMGAWGWIGTISWMLIPLIFFGSRPVYLIIQKIKGKK
jgi:hypothetical protein